MEYILHYKDEATYKIEANSKEEAIEKGDEFWANRTPQVQVEEPDISRSRLEGLRKFKENAEMLNQAAEADKQGKIQAFVSQIQTLKPRIDVLLETGNACLESGIPLKGQGFGCREAYDTNQFITNGWSHLLGFVQKHDPATRKPLQFSKLGIEGGGACNFNLETDGVTVNVTGDALYVLKKFLDNFDRFESELNAYVDRVLEKQQKSVDRLIANAEKKSQENVQPGNPGKQNDMRISGR